MSKSKSSVSEKKIVAKKKKEDGSEPVKKKQAKTTVKKAAPKKKEVVSAAKKEKKPVKKSTVSKKAKVSSVKKTRVSKPAAAQEKPKTKTTTHKKVVTAKKEKPSTQKKKQAQPSVKKGKETKEITQVTEKVEKQIPPIIEPKAVDVPAAKTIDEKEEEKPVKEEFKPRQEKKLIRVNEALTVKVLSEKLEIDVSILIKKLMSLGVLSTINQRLDFEAASLVANEYGYEIEFVPLYGDELLEEEKEEGEQVTRPPVITIMGHVDHGKTSLLDKIRSSNIVGKEAGGITQHIGAYRVKTQDKELMFLDTPGHEAFTAMRARGVKVTDIVVLVVAADDGVMPQTIEAIDHAKAAGVPIVVAINKIDLPGANPSKVKQELSSYDLVAEEWGGKTIFVEVSAKQNLGIDTLLEMLSIQSEMLELRAASEGRARGAIIEARLDKRKGAVATLLVQKGTLKKGDAFVAGSAYGKIRIMVDDKAHVVVEATPSVPVEILGFSGVPQAGDKFAVVANEKEAREIAEKRRMVFREEKLSMRKHITLEELHSEMVQGKVKELGIIVKADVRGSVEALRDSLERMTTKEIKLLVIHSGVGAVNESDILLAAASNAVVISFSVPVSTTIVSLAQREGVDVRAYNIIYNVVADIKAAMEGLLEPDYKDVLIGKAEVRQCITVPKAGLIAGSMITEGKIIRGEYARLYREGTVIYEGKVASLRRFKDDVKEVEKGYECGIQLEGWSDIKENDVVEVFRKEKVARRLIY